MYQDDTRYRQRLRIHLIKRVFLWALFIGAVFVLGLKSEHDRLQRDFLAQVDQVARHSERTAKTFDVALDGFRQFLDLLPAADLDAARRYAATLREHYPELRLFAIVQLVEAAGHLADGDRLQRLGYSGLRLARLRVGDSGASRREEESYRLPMVFTEPQLQSSERLMSIDRAFNRAYQLRDPLRSKQAGRPFQRQDGEVAYLLFAPVSSDAPGGAVANKPWRQAYALLLVHAQDLVPADMVGRTGWSLQLSAEVTDTRPAEQLWRFSNQPFQGMAALFGHFEAERHLSGESQPFVLRFSYRPLWGDLDHQYLGLLTALVLALIILAMRVVSFSQRRNQGELEEHSSLFQQANYDHLTGLPNTNLLMDRVERAIATLNPDEERVVLAYLDLDHFKPINDRWGHDAGDRMLVEVARRLRQQFRMQDTVSRIHGDEFIIMLTMQAQHVDRESVAAKISAAFEQPFDMDGVPLNLGCSQGVAVYPDDAAEVETLISVADQRMYQGKHRRYNEAALPL
ncbi:GGDEF domain-containing protein [Motiliproteus sediminis]|uniref:GGDEF domain-containing protein n=1 Tax=Motiliproteus sediminis TaxID=1468178 RepID=UPI001AEF7424|nr:GGDEF domain-containing protein [Motiliproteus sediminis]